MSYFDTHQLERECWQCSLNLRKHLESRLTFGVFKENVEYVVIWYNYQLHSLNRDNSQTLIEVKFVELTNPIYVKKNSMGNNVEYQSFMVVKLPINYLHKVSFGTIWKNGVFRLRLVNRFSILKMKLMLQCLH